MKREATIESSWETLERASLGSEEGALCEQTRSHRKLKAREKCTCMDEGRELVALNKNTSRFPIWASALIVACCTITAFWFFGGQHYFANQSEIEYRIFHHPEDATDPLSWFSWSAQTGLLSGTTAFIISTIAMVFLNKRSKRAVRDTTQILRKSERIAHP